MQIREKLRSEKRTAAAVLFVMQRDGSSALGSAEGEALCPSESTFLCKAKYNVLYFTAFCCEDVLAGSRGEAPASFQKEFLV